MESVGFAFLSNFHRHQNVSLLLLRKVTSKEVDSGYSADALCKEHPNWNQVLAEKLCHVRNMDELSAVLEETLAMVQTQLGANVSESQGVRPFLSAMLTSKGAGKSLASELEFGDGDIGGLPIWASRMGKSAWTFGSSFWAESGNLLDVPEFRMSGPSGSSSTDWSGRKWHNGVGAWGRVHMLGLNLNCCCLSLADTPFDLIRCKVPISEMQWSSGLPLQVL